MLAVKTRIVIIMRKTANYRVVRLSTFCTDPEEAERKMRKAIGWGVQLQRRVVRRNKLERLLRNRVGTNKVEKLAEKLALEMRGGRRGPIEERERRSMVRKKVTMLMSDKAKDAEEDVKLAFKQFCKSKKELWKIVPWDSRVGFEVRDVLRSELGLEWQERMKVMQKTVDYLVKKHKLLRKEEVPAEWRGIKIADRALEGEIQLPPPLLGEMVGQISDAAKEVLKLPPKTAVFAKIKLEEIQMEVSKAIDAKARWEDMDRVRREESQQTREEAEEEERMETEIYNKQDGTLKLYNMRVTDLPTNKEVFLPDERSNDVEVGLQGLSVELLEVARNYIKNNVDKNGNVKEGNLTKTQEAGLKDLENLVKENHIVTKTDKSGRQCLLTENEYIQVGEQHVNGDPVKSRKEIEKNEDEADL